MQLLQGKQLSNNLLEDLKVKLSELSEKPRLAIIQIGDEKPSNVYVSIKEKVGKEIGIDIDVYKYQTGDFAFVSSKIEELNDDKTVHGIILQLPTPGSEVKPLLELIDPQKDVDGLTSNSLGKIWHNESQEFLGATPKAIMYAIEHISKSYGESLSEFLTGKNVLVINHNILIGRPLAGRLLNLDATVTLAHSKTKNLEKYLQNADIIVTATGNKIITLQNSSNLKQDVIIIDSGYSIVNGIVTGDVEVEAVQEKASWLTPVPGGIGPLGVAMLMQNTYDAFLSFQDTNHQP